MSCAIINSIKNIQDYTYLELGIHKNANFNLIRCKEKFSVDTNGRAMFTGTTDEYFAQLDESVRFDIIFIDANHDYDFVLNDFNNSLKHCNKWILIHDMIPPSVEYTASTRCSDSYKFLYFLLKETKFEIYPMDNNLGLTLIKMPAHQVSPDESYKTIDYDTVMNYLKTQHLYSDNEIIAILNNQ